MGEYMKSKDLSCILIIVCLIIFSSANDLLSDETEEQKNTEFQSVTVGGQWFFAYLSDKQEKLFTVTRGYINVNVKLNETFSGRITPDMSLDQEGDGIGSLELRLKYVYLKWNLPDVLFLSKSYFEMGLVHRPWLDFEEHINNYRLQGTMFIERNGLINSADFGITFMALFGGEMNENFQKKVNKTYPGLYGSMAIGIYNGGGYHALEENKNKSIEARISIRPLHQIFPGLQLSYHGVYGKGNIKNEPNWTVNMGFFSWDHENFVITGTYYNGVGNFNGSAIDTLGNSYDQDGYSVFGEYTIQRLNIGLTGRYDFFRQKKYRVTGKSRRYICGIAYYFYEQCKFLLDYDIYKVDSFLKEKTSKFQASIEVKF
jgi:hypothetical protein